MGSAKFGRRMHAKARRRLVAYFHSAPKADNVPVGEMIKRPPTKAAFCQKKCRIVARLFFAEGGVHVSLF
jgi:hypothetical protein